MNRSRPRIADAVHRWLRGAAHALYRRLPLSWENKLAVKGALFRAAAPLLRGTDAYARWYYDARMRAEDYLAFDAPPPRGRHAPDAAPGHAPGDDDAAAFVATPAAGAPGALRARVIAFYLPQFHPIPENDAWWGAGFTEWTNVERAKPRFAGHDQPRVPGALGRYDLRDPEVMRRQIDLARAHGLSGFCFYHYDFGGKRLLETPVENWLADATLDFPFCLCWANESWSRRWDGREQDVLIAQTYGPEHDARLIDDLLRPLRDPRYLRVDGRPLLLVYRPGQHPDPAALVRTWRERARAAGLGELFLALVQSTAAEDPRPWGFDAAIEFPPMAMQSALRPINERLDGVEPDFAGMVMDYGALADAAMARPRPDYPLIRGVTPGWDNEARRPGRGYAYVPATPRRYRDWLRAAAEDAAAAPVAGGEALVFVNAWNEWAEGAYLEPDARHGYAFLHATRQALAAESPRRIALVVHDARPNGAQQLALHLLREFARLGVHAELLLLDGGPLEDALAAAAGRTHRVWTLEAGAILALAARLHADGIRGAIVNSVAGGRIAAPLAAAGVRLTTLVHELPTLIRGTGLLPPLQALAAAGTRWVVPAAAVRDGLVSLLGEDAVRNVRVRPQGLYRRNRHRGRDDLADVRARMREAWGLPQDARIVLAAGYADRRKGVDLLARAAVRACARDARLQVVWAGACAAEVCAEVRAALDAAGLSGRFHFIGPQDDVDDAYAAADVYALVSREDPFPSVALEAWSMGVPVVAFAGSGGIADLIAAHAADRGDAPGGGRDPAAQAAPDLDSRADAGIEADVDTDLCTDIDANPDADADDAPPAGPLGMLAPAFDTDAFADALLRLLDDAALHARCAAAGRHRVETRHAFRGYALDVLAMAGIDLPRVSAVVPNYNYARYLPQRLEGICAQRLPPAEVLVLDDASTDGSVDAVLEARPALQPDIRLFRSRRNGGSVFRQWRRGARLVEGEFVWIAEADDAADPGLLEALIAPMQAHPDVVMAYCQSAAIDGEGGTLSADYHGYTDDLSPTRWRRAYLATGAEEAEAGLAVRNTLPNVSAVVFRRAPLLDTLERHWDDIAACRIAGDWVVYLHLLTRGRIAYDPRPLNRHRRHARSATAQLDAAAHLAEIEAVQALAARLYPLSPATERAARAWRAQLHKSFGLPAS